MATTDTQAGELRELGADELVLRLRESKEELFNLRFQSATGQLDNHGRLRAVKRDIARIYTEMRERELGIGSAPVAEPVVETADDTKADKKAKKAAKADDDKADKAEKKAKKADKAEQADKADKEADA